MKKSLKDLVIPEEVAPVEVATSSFLSDEELSKQNIFFATPCYGGLMTDQYHLSMFRVLEVLRNHKISHQLTTLRNESLITRARNILTAMFLAREDATHLMFIDADIEFDAQDIVKLVRANLPIAVGAYPKKTLPIQYAINLKITDPAKGTVNVKNDLVEVLDASTGFFMIKREVIEKMIVAYPELHIKNDSSIDPSLNKHCYALFDTLLDPTDNRYLSEDYTFCRRWQKLGGSIWLDPTIKLNHVGSYTFEGDVSKIFNGKLVIPANGQSTEQKVEQ
jgi:hypothetical protein